MECVDVCPVIIHRGHAALVAHTSKGIIYCAQRAVQACLRDVYGGSGTAGWRLLPAYRTVEWRMTNASHPLSIFVRRVCGDVDAERFAARVFGATSPQVCHCEL